MYMGCTCLFRIRHNPFLTLGKIHYTNIKSNLKNPFNCRHLWKDVHAIALFIWHFHDKIVFAK